MHYLNAAQAARAIGIGDKTIRRWLKANKFPQAIVKPDGEYAIPESAVEAMISERARFPHAPLDQKVTSHDQDEDERAADSAPEALTSQDQIHELDAFVEKLSDKIEMVGSQLVDLRTVVAVLAEKLRILESQLSLMQETIATQATSPPLDTSAYVEPLPIEVAQIAIVAPQGTVSASEFAAHLGISYDDFKNYMKRGISGEKLDITEVPHHTRKGYTNKYLTAIQQEKAIEIQKRHNKLKETNE